MRSPIPPAALIDLAASQDGVLHIDDIEAHGLRVRRLVDRGWLERAAPRTYRVAGSPRTHRQALRIGIVALRPHGVVSHIAAASVHGLDRAVGASVEFLVPRGCRTRLEWPVHTSTRWIDSDRVYVDGLPVTSATRTILDLALARRPRFVVEAAIDSAVRLGLSSPEAIARRLETLRGSGRWGCRLIDRLLPDSGGHSPLERRFLELCRRAGLEPPRTQVVFRDAAGRHVARVDFVIGERLVVEVTGRLGHVSDAERARDAQRRNELQDLGLTVIEYTSTQVFDRPAFVLRDLRRRVDAT